MPQDPNDALLNPVSPRVREFDDFFANQRAKRALGATKLNSSTLAPQRAQPANPAEGSAPAPVIPPQNSHVVQRANASKTVLDAVDDYMESMGGWDAAPQFVPDDDGKLISPRAKIIRNPELAPVTMERIGGPGVVGDKNNPFWRRIEDASKAYRQSIRTTEEQAIHGGLQERSQALTATKQAGLQTMLKTAQAQDPISQREIEEKARTVTGIKESIIPQGPKQPSANDQLLKKNPTFMVGPQQKTPELPGQSNLRGLVDDELFNTGTAGPRTFAEVALDVGKDIGLDPGETQRAMLVSQRTDPQKYNQTLGAPADQSKSDDITRFLLFALAFGAQKALQIVMQERRDRRMEGRELARGQRDDARLGIDEERLGLEHRRVNLAETESENRNTRDQANRTARQTIANMNANIRLLEQNADRMDRRRGDALRVLLAEYNGLMRSMSFSMTEPEKIVGNPELQDVQRRINALMNAK